MRARSSLRQPYLRDRWLLSYADFTTLLFAFFATLYASSTIESAKREAWAESARRVILVDGGAAEPTGVMPGGADGVKPWVERARTELTHDLADDIRAGRLELSADGRGLVLSMPESSAFPVGGATLSPDAEQTLGRLAGAIARLPNPIRVEGHTDDVPIHTSRFASNWELSAERAIRVVAFLIENGQLPPERLSAAGFGEFHPRVANESPDARAKNRRVDIVIVDGGMVYP
jgi:chemotaxis protein MotB